MSHLADTWIIPWLAFLAEWSVRWGVVLVLLAASLALRPPKRAATRQLLCLATLTAGLLLPVAPRWGGATFPVPGWGTTRARLADVNEPVPSEIGPPVVEVAGASRSVESSRFPFARKDSAGMNPSRSMARRDESRPAAFHFLTDDAWRRS